MIIYDMNDDLTRLNRVIAKDNKTARWDAYNIEVFSPHPGAYYNPEGVFRNGQYGYIRVVRPNSKGHWAV